MKDKELKELTERLMISLEHDFDMEEFVKEYSKWFMGHRGYDKIKARKTATELARGLIKMGEDGR